MPVSEGPLGISGAQNVTTLCINMIFFSDLLVLEIFHLVNDAKYTLSDGKVLTKTDQNWGIQSYRKAETLT